MKKALVTGGSGFLGSFIADALVERGWGVRVYDRRPSDHLPEGQEMIVGELADADALAAAADGCQAVYHLAALADIDHARDRPREAAAANVLGTVNVLEAARRAGAERFLFASTVYVYSRSGGFYRCSKQAGEAFVEEYRRRYGLSYTILRYGSLYGPRADVSNGLFRLLEQAASGGPIRHPGSADEAREYVHVEDAARLSVDVLDGAYADQHLIVTGPYPMRIGDLFTMFSEILGRELEVEYLEQGNGEHYRMTPYSFQPRVGRKLTSNCYVDMGQGILQILAELERRAATAPDDAGPPSPSLPSE